MAVALAQTPSASQGQPAKTEASQGAVSAVLTQQLVVVENGKEVLKPVSSVKPGDLIEYRVVYTNHGAKPVTEVVADLPIAEGLEYQPRSALPRQGSQVAEAKGGFGAEPLMRIVNGKKVVVPYSEYRRLRWSVGSLAAGAEVRVSARARVSSGAPVPSAGAQVPVATGKGG